MTSMIIGNWKMHGVAADLAELDAIAAWLAASPEPGVEAVICPPATLLHRAALRLSGTRLGLGGQDCHPAQSGAHTGDLSAPMLAEAGAGLVILGHSERRRDHGEGDGLVRAKAEAAGAAGLRAVICVGESEEERAQGATAAVIDRQIEASVPAAAAPETTLIAYEPVWAIGSGRTPTQSEIAEVHDRIGAALARRTGRAGPFRILYGGSVKAGNAGGILALPGVAGALVGGASLKAGEFCAILRAAAKTRTIRGSA